MREIQQLAGCHLLFSTPNLHLHFPRTIPGSGISKANIWPRDIPASRRKESLRETSDGWAAQQDLVEVRIAMHVCSSLQH